MSFFNRRRDEDDYGKNDYGNNFDRDYEINHNNNTDDFFQPRQSRYNSDNRGASQNNYSAQRGNYNNQSNGGYNNSQNGNYNQPRQQYSSDVEQSNSRQSYFRDIGVDAPINAPNSNYYNRQNEPMLQPEVYSQQGMPIQGNTDGTAGVNIVISTPRNFQDVKSLIVSLSNRQSVIVDIGSIAENDAYRIMDYLSGAIFALKGSIQKISKNMYALAPHGSSIQIPHDIKNRLKEEK